MIYTPAPLPSPRLLRPQRHVAPWALPAVWSPARPPPTRAPCPRPQVTGVPFDTTLVHVHTIDPESGKIIAFRVRAEGAGCVWTGISGFGRSGFFIFRGFRGWGLSAGRPASSPSGCVLQATRGEGAAFRPRAGFRGVRV